MKKHMKSNDGLYHVSGHSYPSLIGSRAQVWHKNAYKTSGDLTRNDLLMNKLGRIVSKKKHHTAKKEKRLEKAGYKTKKGKFGSFKVKAKKGKKGKTQKRGRA